jgi:hypothetical protein
MPMIVFKIEGKTDEAVTDFPLSDIADLLYQLIDTLNDIEGAQHPHVRLPVTKTHRSDYGQVTATIQRKEGE